MGVHKNANKIQKEKERDALVKSPMRILLEHIQWLVEAVQLPENKGNFLREFCTMFFDYRHNWKQWPLSKSDDDDNEYFAVILQALLKLKLTHKSGNHIIWKKQFRWKKKKIITA